MGFFSEVHIVSSYMDELNSLEEYIENVELFIESRSEDLEPVTTEGYFHWNIKFPTILRATVFLSCYAYFEHQLVTMCKDFERQEDILVKYNDLTGQGIEKAAKYLKKVCNIEFPDQSPEWNRIKKYNLIRNCFAHNLGILEGMKNENKIIEALSSFDSVDYDSFHFITISSGDFCKETIADIRNFLNQLRKQASHLGNQTDSF
ncbi:hypothetical protein O0550_23785 [Brevibacillus halotolerans]|uniref:hypothetical protein n=1 Tax=Brevibacillus TaxID=55080 RepID=UPI00215C92CE|nr:MULTISPECIES: hypothetical protein [Brevibacillus]MCR8966168.1 hypothetical protein [Brevibacillus laterosporus]MCZ0838325.1 hypothetical protein [Brevibacillus halotolerans]